MTSSNKVSFLICRAERIYRLQAALSSWKEPSREGCLRVPVEYKQAHLAQRFIIKTLIMKIKCNSSHSHPNWKNMRKLVPSQVECPRSVKHVPFPAHLRSNVKGLTLCLWWPVVYTGSISFWFSQSWTKTCCFVSGNNQQPLARRNRLFTAEQPWAR